MAKQKLIIDADPGIGDAVAIATALLDPELEVVALTACGGMVSGEQAYKNLQTIISLLDPVRWPRLGWSDTPPVHLLNDSVITGILKGQGPHGLGECQPIAAPLHQPTDSAKLLVDLVRSQPGELTLLTLGPLTNLFAAQERYPEFLSEIKQLVVCGGSVSAGGDVTSTAEYNMRANPPAAREILTSAANKTLVPLDVSQQFGLSFDEYSLLGIDEFSRLGRLLNCLLPFALRAHRNLLGREGVILQEVVAVAAIAHPELFEQTPMTVDVELVGDLTIGMTVFDRRGLPHWKENIEVLTEVDLLGIKDYLLRIISASEVKE